MTLKLRSGALALAIVGGMLAATAPVAAQTVLRDGTYTIRVDPLYPHLPAADQCLIQGNNGFGGPVRYLWAEPRASNYLCGWGDFDAFFDNGQALYTLKLAFLSPPGLGAYVLVNKRSGQCLRYDKQARQATFSSQGCDPRTGDLSAVWYISGKGTYTFSTLRPYSRPGACLIFGNNGYDFAPQVFRWSNVPSDGQWCGLGSEYAVQMTGQAIFGVTRVAD